MARQGSCSENVITEFEWSRHARHRLRQRRVSEAAIEAAIQFEHAYRVSNAGDGDWVVPWFGADGREFGVVYDHPVYGDDTLVRVVTLFRVWDRRRH